LAAVLLGGCASISQSECTTGNWQARGLRDGEGGEPVARLDDYAKDCAGYGVAPDRQAYQQGYQQGLARYCTPEGGLHAGRYGYGYASVCPAATEPAFLAQYQRGHYVHEVEADLDEVHRRIDAEQNNITSDRIDGATRDSIRAHLRDLYAGERALRQHLSRAEEALARGEPLPQLYQPGYWRQGFPF
jgi:hypothetical protein